MSDLLTRLDWLLRRGVAKIEHRGTVVTVEELISAISGESAPAAPETETVPEPTEGDAVTGEGDADASSSEEQNRW